MSSQYMIVLVLASSALGFRHVGDGGWPCEIPRYCNHGDWFGDPTDCQFYYQCVGYELFRRACNEEEWWDTRFDNCGKPHEAKCQEPCPSEAPNTESPSTEEPPTPGPCPVDVETCATWPKVYEGVRFPDTWFCEQYYVCVSGSLTGPQACGPLTVFSYKIQMCKFKDEDLDCENRCGSRPTIGPSTTRSHTVTTPRLTQRPTRSTTTEVDTTSLADATLTSPTTDTSGSGPGTSTQEVTEVPSGATSTSGSGLGTTEADGTGTQEVPGTPSGTTVTTGGVGSSTLDVTEKQSSATVSSGSGQSTTEAHVATATTATGTNTNPYLSSTRSQDGSDSQTAATVPCNDESSGKGSSIAAFVAGCLASLILLLLILVVVRGIRRRKPTKAKNPDKVLVETEGYGGNGDVLGPFVMSQEPYLSIRDLLFRSMYLPGSPSGTAKTSMTLRRTRIPCPSDDSSQSDLGNDNPVFTDSCRDSSSAAVKALLALFDSNQPHSGELQEDELIDPYFTLHRKAVVDLGLPVLAELADLTSDSDKG